MFDPFCGQHLSIVQVFCGSCGRNVQFLAEAVDNKSRLYVFVFFLQGSSTPQFVIRLLYYIYTSMGRLFAASVRNKIFLPRPQQKAGEAVTINPIDPCEQYISGKERRTVCRVSKAVTETVNILFS